MQVGTKNKNIQMISTKKPDSIESGFLISIDFFYLIPSLVLTNGKRLSAFS